MVVDCADVETGCMLEKYVTSPLLLLSFASILLLLLLLRRDMHFCFFVEVLLLLIIFLVGCAAAAAGACAAYNLSTEAERGTGYCFFLLRFCGLHCDASDVYCCCCSWLLLFLSFRLAIFRLWLLTALLLRRDACWKNTKWLHTCSPTTKGDIYTYLVRIQFFSSSFSV